MSLAITRSAARDAAWRALDLLLLCLALVGLWQGISWLAGSETLPGPLQTLEQLFRLFGQPRFQRDLMATSQAYAIALALAMAGGLTLGVLCGGWRAVGEEVEPTLLALIATPKVMFYPIILLFFGLGDAAKIFFGVLHGLPTVVIMTANALRTLRPIYRKAALTLRLSRTRYALYVLVPAVFPEIVASFRICFALTLLGVLVGEMFASTRGLGHRLFASIGANDQPTIMAITLLLFVFAGVGSSVLLSLSRRARSDRAMT